MKYIEAPHKETMAIIDGSRALMVARKVPSGGWMVSTKGFSMLDKKPSPVSKNRFGVIEPSLYLAKDRREVLRIFQGILDTGRTVC